HSAWRNVPADAIAMPARIEVRTTLVDAFSPGLQAEFFFAPDKTEFPSRVRNLQSSRSQEFRTHPEHVENSILSHCVCTAIMIRWLRVADLTSEGRNDELESRAISTKSVSHHARPRLAWRRPTASQPPP